jgi:hypothetical protein
MSYAKEESSRVGNMNAHFLIATKAMDIGTEGHFGHSNSGQKTFVGNV